MALTGLDIYKLLPKTNCKKCGFPTCLAFAMALANKKTSLDKCPDISEESKVALESASEPPIRTITIGAEDNKIELGGETVLYRHEKTFVHPCGLGVCFSDNLSTNELNNKINNFNNLTFERVGKKERVELILVKNDSGDSSKFVNIITELKNRTKAIFILESKNLSALEEGLKILKDNHCAIGYADSSNIDQMTNLAKTYNAVLIVTGDNLDDIAKLVQKIVSSGYREIMIDLTRTGNILENLIQVRRLALKKSYRLLGYPTMVSITGDDDYDLISMSITYIEKYASVVILPEPINWQFLPLVTLRQNIYTDPQKPVTVEPKLYTIGGQPTDKSPLLVTTNFSLTFYTVEPEIINSKMPSWLLVVDSDGLSVLTAWAAEKFTPERIFDAMKKCNVESTVSHRKLIIPGYVAVMSGKLNDLTGWEVLVGPREASGIPKFLKTIWQ